MSERQLGGVPARPNVAGDRWKTVLLSVCVWLFALLLAEGAVRLWRPQITYSKLLNRVGDYYRVSTENTFGLQPNFRGSEPSMAFPGQQVKVSINAAGLRGRELDPSANKIIAIGDSYTFGVYVGDDETYPAVLERLVAGRSSGWQVINAGYAAGYETDQQYSWLSQHINKFAAKVVVLGIFLGNDIMGIKTSAWQAPDSAGLPTRWIDRDLVVADNGMLINKRRGLGTVGAEYIHHVPLLRESHFAVAIGHLLDRWLFPQVAEEQLAAFRHIFGDYSPEFLRQEAIFLKLVAGMRDETQAHGAKFMVVLLPINFMVQPELLAKVLPTSPDIGKLPSPYYDRLSLALAARQIEHINIDLEMRQDGRAKFYPINGEVHFNPLGHQFVAEQLHKRLTALHWVP